jgi:uncharacterized membrane protein YkoI
LNAKWLNRSAKFLLYAPSSDASALQLMNRDVTSLLAAPHHVFWSTVLLDESFARFLDTYLCFVRRPFEAQALRSALAVDASDGFASLYDVASLQVQLLGRVFRVLVRIAARKESEHEFLSPEHYAAALPRAGLVSVPMLFDIAAVYGQCAPDTVAQMITGFFGKLPTLAAQLAAHLPMVGDALRAASQRAAAAFVWHAAVETVAFVHDIMHALRAFCLAYEPALAVLSDDFLVLMADAVRHAILLADQIVSGAADAAKVVDELAASADVDDDDDDDDVDVDDKSKAKVSSTAATAKQSDEERLAAFVETAQRHSVLAQRSLQHATAILALSMRAVYWVPAIGDDRRDEVLGSGDAASSTKRDVARQQSATRGACLLVIRLGVDNGVLLRDTATVDDFVGRIVDLHMALPGVELDVLERAIAVLRDVGVSLGDAKSLGDLVRVRSRLALRMAAAAGDVDDAAWRALEEASVAVRQVMPELGDGFVLRALEALNRSAEAVVNAVLNNELPPSVAQMSRSTTLAQLANATVARRELTTGADAIRERMAVYGDDEFDVLGGRANQAIDEGRIYRGKRQDPEFRRSLDGSFHDQFIEQLYNDDYDDSFDAFEPGVADGEGLAQEEVVEREEQAGDTEQDPKEAVAPAGRGAGRGAGARGRGNGRGGARTAAAHKYKSHHRKDRAQQKRAI